MSGEVCWGVGGDQGSCGKRCGGGVGKCLGVWGEIRKDVWGVEKCGRVYGVSGEGGKRVYGERKCVGVWGKNVGRCREMCQGVGPQHTSHISFLTSPFPTSPLTFPTPQHTFLHLFPHLAPHPNTFSYYPHVSPHLLKVWRSYHETKFLWRSYWQPSASAFGVLSKFKC